MPLQQLSTAMAAPQRDMTLDQLGGVECLLIVTSPRGDGPFRVALVFISTLAQSKGGPICGRRL
jgi:hypothetical protein